MAKGARVQIDEERLTDFVETEKTQREMRRVVRNLYGPYASEKIFEDCPGCGKPCGVRQRRRHRKLGCVAAEANAVVGPSRKVNA